MAALLPLVAYCIKGVMKSEDCQGILEQRMLPSARELCLR